MDRTVRPHLPTSFPVEVRRLLSALAVVALVALGAVVSPTAANACSCARSSLTDSLDRADVAFAGVLSDSETHSRPSPGHIELTFTVNRVYKGSAYTEQIVTTPPGDGACGLDPELGTALVVFGSHSTQVDGSRSTSEVYTTICYGNLATATPPSVLGPGYAPLAGSSLQVDRAVRVDDTLTRGLKIAGISVAGLVILSSLGLVFLWRRRALG